MACKDLSDVIYAACKNNYIQVKAQPSIPAIHEHCNSSNFKAIAEMNLYMYNLHISNDSPRDICDTYLQDWTKYEELARYAEERELNVKTNTAWKNIKKDGRKMWGDIDWDGKSEIKNEKMLHDSQIQRYFKNIFQSVKTKNHPTYT